MAPTSGSDLGKHHYMVSIRISLLSAWNWPVIFKMATERATYSHGHHESVVKTHARRTAQDSAAFLLPHIKRTDKILDLGCGPGSITVDLALLVPGGEVIGGDQVAAVVQQAQALAKERQVHNVSFQQLDGNQLPFGDGTFDIVYCHQTLQHVGNPTRLLKEMRRVTKEGGLVAARDADYKAFAWFPEHPGLDLWLSLYQKIAKANGAEPNAGRYLPAWAREAGFRSEDVQFSWSVWNYQDEAGKAFGAAWVDRAVHSSYATSARQHGLASDEDIQEISRAWDEWSKTDDRFIVIPSGEILCRV
jgi:ubiquinone/menaquinone biosynthesis C-methylase UbiE